MGFCRSLRPIEVASRLIGRGYERSTDSAANRNWAGSLERLNWPIPIGLDRYYTRTLNEDQGKVGEICEKNGAVDILVANSTTARDRMWESRKCLFEAANHFGSLYKSLDVVVPRSLIPTLIREINEVSEKYRIKAMPFGHAGDGNVHVLLFKGELSDEEWEKRSDQAQRDLYQETVDLGGKITAEHGIGLLRKPFLSMNLDPYQIELLKGLKKAFDPKNILNPGKIFDL